MTIYITVRRSSDTHSYPFTSPIANNEMYMGALVGCVLSDDEKLKIKMNNCTVWLDTTITTCTACYNALRPRRMSSEHLMKTEMNMYKIMSMIVNIDAMMKGDLMGCHGPKLWKSGSMWTRIRNGHAWLENQRRAMLVPVNEASQHCEGGRPGGFYRENNIKPFNYKKKKGTNQRTWYQVTEWKGI